MDWSKILADGVAQASIIASLIAATVGALMSYLVLRKQMRQNRRNEGAKIVAQSILQVEANVNQERLQVTSELRSSAQENIKLLTPIYKALIEAQGAFESLSAQADENDQMFVRQATLALQRLSQFALSADEPKLLFGADYDFACQRLLDQFARIFLTLKATQEERRDPDSIREVNSQLQDLRNLIAEFRSKAADFARYQVGAASGVPRGLAISSQPSLTSA
jgi:hypothetical protein